MTGHLELKNSNFSTPDPDLDPHLVPFQTNLVELTPKRIFGFLFLHSPSILMYKKVDNLDFRISAIFEHFPISSYVLLTLNLTVT